MTRKTDAQAMPVPVLPPLWLLIGVSALGPIVLNGVLPANTQIMRDLSTDYGLVQLILTVYLIATMFAQLVFGGLADRRGRRPTMIIGLIVFSIGGFICAVAQSIEILLFGRFVQGFGSSVCIFLPRTIVRDVYPRDRAASVIGYMTTAMMAAPLFGPAFGGWITDIGSWRYMYGLLGVLGLLFAVFAFRFQNETLIGEARNATTGSFIANAVKLFSEPLFVWYLLLQTATVGVYYSFLGGAPYVVMELRGVSATDYGLWFMMIAIGYLLGNLVAGRFSVSQGVDRMIYLAQYPLLLAAILFWALSGWDHPLGLFLPMQMVAFSNGICLPNVMSAIMSVKPGLAGSASGLAGTLQTAAGIVMTILLGVFLEGTALPLYTLISICVVISVLSLVGARRTTLQRLKGH